MSGFVYCMISEGIPNYIKVGFSLNINNRIIALSTGVPFNFECKFYIEIKKELMANTEKKIHKDIVDAGFEKKKEFFKCNPEDIIYIFEKYGIIIYDKSKAKQNKNFICNKCNYKTSRNLNYLRHLNSNIHKENDNKTFICIYEDDYYNDINNLDKNTKLTVENIILKEKLKIKEELLKEKLKIKEELLKEKSKQLKIENKIQKEIFELKDKHIEYLQKTNRMK